jgi:alkylhydroperoxidase family enzyme
MKTVDHDQVDAVPEVASLAPLLHEEMVSWEELEKRYRPLLRLVDTVLGVVPNCDRYLEIWPPAFRTYNIMVPNLLNLPVPMFGWGGPPAADVGLAMYVASRTAECGYCSAHSCSFALRRGASPDTVAAALLPDQTSCNRAELATIAVARSLARIPCELTAAERDELVAVYGESNAEWIVLAVVMMGFLNKFMDTIGVELEQAVMDETRTVLGGEWSPGKAGALLEPTTAPDSAPPVDGWRTRLRLLRLLPAAVRYDRSCQQGVPKRWPAVGTHLRDRTGHDFPVLAQLRSERARRSVASMLRANLDASTTLVGIEAKVLAGAVFAQVVADPRLAGDVRALAGNTAVDSDLLEDVAAFARDAAASPPVDDPRIAAVLTLTRAASSSPSRVDTATVAACRDAELSAAAIVEVVTWVAVLQMLHRLTCYTTCSD